MNSDQAKAIAKQWDGGKGEPFVAKKSDQYTIAELYTPPMFIKTQEGATAYLEALVTLSKEGLKQDELEARRVHRLNIGYYAGYYDRVTMKRVYKLFDTTHPVFGNKQPTVTEALEAGKQMAKQATKKGSKK